MALLSALILVYLLLFLVPYSNVSIPDDDLVKDQEWKATYVWQDGILTIIYIPFGLFLCFYFLLKPKPLKNIVKFILIALSLFYFILSLGDLTVPIQDFVPSWGVVISMMLFPIFIIFLISVNLLDKKNKSQASNGLI